MTMHKIYDQADKIYLKLSAEKEIFDEILFRLYIYDFDDFEHYFEDYEFEVKMSETNILVNVNYDQNYSINLTYKDECLCFTEILYN